MRKIGVAFLGLVIGLVAGILLTEVIARPAVSGDGEISVGLGIVLGSIVPILAIAGAAVAIKIDRGSGASE